MGDPWNLSLDQSCFEDWNEEKIIIRGEDLTDVYKRINTLSDLTESDSDFVKLLDRQLSLFLDIPVNEHDAHAAVKILHAVATKLHLLPESIILLLCQSSKKIFTNFLETSGNECVPQEKLKQIFEILNLVLEYVKTSRVVAPSINLLEMIDISYKMKSEDKSTSSVYSDLIYKNASSLLLLLLPLIEQESNQFGPGLCDILKKLVSIGKYSCKLDPKSMASVWKLILKTLQLHQELCTELELENAIAIAFLVDEIISRHFDGIVLKGHLEPRHAKIVGFMLKVIVGLAEKVNALESPLANTAVLRLVVYLQRLTPDAANFELGFSEDGIRLLESNVTLTIHPFTENLLKTKQLKCSLESAINSYSEENLRYLLRFLGLVMTPCYSSNLATHLSAKEVLEIFFSVAEKAHADFNSQSMVYGIRHSGQGLYTVPLYELLVTQSCSCLAIIPADAISDCIVVLLNAALRCGYWPHLFASDILAFLSRFGTAQFCLELVQHVFILSSPSPNHRCTHLLNRLIPLLSNNGRSTLLKTHPVENYADVWAVINWRCFTPEQQTTISNSIISATFTSLNPSASVILRLSALSKSGNQTAFRGRSDILPWLIRATTQLVLRLSCNQAQDYKKHIEHLIVCSMRAMLSIVQPEVQEHHLQLMQILKIVMDARSLNSVLLEASTFLLNVGPVGFIASTQQPAILRVVANLFSECLGSSSAVVRYHALNTFEVFFKVTPHASIAPSCIKDGQDQLVKQYISRTSSKPAVEDLASFWKSQTKSLSIPPRLYKSFPSLPSDASVGSMGFSDVISNGSIAKRPRLESDEQLQFLLSNLSKIVADIGTLCPIPAWSKDEIRERVASLNSFL